MYQTLYLRNRKLNLLGKITPFLRKHFNPLITSILNHSFLVVYSVLFHTITSSRCLNCVFIALINGCNDPINKLNGGLSRVIDRPQLMNKFVRWIHMGTKLLSKSASKFLVLYGAFPFRSKPFDDRCGTYI